MRKDRFFQASTVTETVSGGLKHVSKKKKVQQRIKGKEKKNYISASPFLCKISTKCQGTNVNMKVFSKKAFSLFKMQSWHFFTCSKAKQRSIKNDWFLSSGHEDSKWNTFPHFWQGQGCSNDWIQKPSKFDKHLQKLLLYNAHKCTKKAQLKKRTANMIRRAFKWVTRSVGGKCVQKSFASEKRSQTKGNVSNIDAHEKL